MSSNLNGSGGSSVNKTNLSAEEVFLNSIKIGANASLQGNSPHTASAHLGGAQGLSNTSGATSTSPQPGAVDNATDASGVV